MMMTMNPIPIQTCGGGGFSNPPPSGKIVITPTPKKLFLFNQISDLQLNKVWTAQFEVALKQSTRLLKNKPPNITS